MPYVIASACIDVNDKSCVEECPVDCIYEGDRKSYINPKECIDCGACEPVCPVEAISQDRRVADERRAVRRGQPGVLHRGAARPRRAARRTRAAPRKVGDLGTDTPLVARAGHDCSTATCSSTRTCTCRCSARWRRPGSTGPATSGPTASSRTSGTPTACPRPDRLDELFEEQGVDARAAVLRVQPRRPPATSASRTCCRSSSTTRRGSGRSPTSTRTCTSRSPTRCAASSTSAPRR